MVVAMVIYKRNSAYKIYHKSIFNKSLVAMAPRQTHRNFIFVGFAYVY